MNFHLSSSWMRQKPSSLCLSWWRKHVQLETGYVSETELNVLTRELLLLACSKEMRERSLEFKSWAKIQWKPESKVWESLRESEWMRVECESSKLTPQPLFKGRMAGHRWERPGSTASDRWKRLGPLAVGRGPADPRVRPNPRWPPCWQPGPTALLTVKKILNFGAGQTLLRKDV